jgi:hypothetical protein
MPDLLIRIKKKTDGAAALSCTRADGSVTWQRQDGQVGRFFPLHDLTHLALEQVVPLPRAFYGLVADGWDLEDFGRNRSKGPIPEDAIVAEVIVGFLDLERATGILATANEFNEKLDTWLHDNKRPPTAFRLTELQLGDVRSRRGELIARWRALPPGDALEIPFERCAQPATPTGDTRRIMNS